MAVSLVRAWLEGDWRMLTPRMLAWTQAISWWLAFSVVMTGTLTGVRDLVLSAFADSLIRASGSPKRQTRWKLKKRGVLVIANLQLSPLLLDDLDLPVLAHSAKVETLELSLPLLAFLLARNISLQIRGFHVELTSRKLPSERDCRGLDAQVEAEKRARQRQRLIDIDRLLWDDNSPPPSFMQKFQDFLIFTVASRAAQCVQVSISQVTIRFRPSSLSSLPEHLHRTLALRLDSLSLSNGHPASSDLLLPRAKVVDVRGCKLELVNESSRPSAPSSGVQAGNDSAPTGKTDSSSRLHRQAPHRPAVTVVKRWSFSVTVEAGWGLWHQGSKNSGVVVSASLDMGALIMSANELVVQYLSGLAVDLAEFTDYAKYRQTRPRASVLEDPRAWWRHAIGSVARDLRAAAMDVELTGLSQSLQATLRLQYEKQYSDFVAGRCWSVASAQTRLQQLEQQLGTLNCAFVRFRVALAAESEGLTHSEPAWDQHMTNVRNKLQDLKYLLSGGSIPEPQAHKPVIEVSSRFTCPKLCVLLTSASDLDWGAEVSLHEVALRFTETGSLHAEVSCRELLVRNFYVPESELVGNIVHSVSFSQTSAFPSSSASSPSIGPRASSPSPPVPGSSQPSPLHPSLSGPAVPAAAAGAAASCSLSSGSTPFLAVCFVQRYGSRPRPCQLPTCLVGRWHLTCPSELKKPSSGRFFQFLRAVRSDKYIKASQQSPKAALTPGEMQQQQHVRDPVEGVEQRKQPTHPSTEGSRGSKGEYGETKWNGERELGVLELGWGEDELQRLHTRVEAHMSPLRVFLDRRWLFQLMQLLSSSPSTQSQPTAASQGRALSHLASQAGKGVSSRAQAGAGGGKGLGGEGARERGGEMAMGDAAGGSGDSEWMPDITKQQHYLYRRRGDSGSVDSWSNGAATSAAKRPPGTPGGGAGQNCGGFSDGGAASLNPTLFADLQEYVREFGQHVARKRVQHVRENLPEIAARVGSILFIIPCRDIAVMPRPSSSASAGPQRSSVPSAGGDGDFQAFFGMGMDHQAPPSQPQQHQHQHHRQQQRPQTQQQNNAQAWQNQGTGAQRARPAPLTPPLLVISLSEIVLDTRPTESSILQKQDVTSESAASSSDQSPAAKWRKVVASMASHRGWMQRQHVGPLPPNSLEQVQVELTLEAYLTRASLSNVADLRERVDFLKSVSVSASVCRCTEPIRETATTLLSVELVTSVFIVQLSPLIAKEVSRLVHTLNETFASTGDLSSTSKEPPPPPPVTPGAHQLGWRFSLKTPFFLPLLSRLHPPPLTHITSTCLQGGGFLVEACQEMVPHSKADCPYGVCRCRQWVPSSDTAVVLVSTAEDLRGCPPSTSKSVPPTAAVAAAAAAAAASSSAGGSASAVEGQRHEPVVVVFRVRLDKIRVEAEQHNDKIAMVRELFPPGKAMMARVFYRWRLQTVVARGCSDEAIFAAYESLQRAKAQVAVQLQEAGTLHQVAVKVALLPFSCDTNNLSAVLTFLTHLQAAISRTTSAPRGPSNSRARQMLTFGSSEVERDSWGEPTPTALPSSRPTSSSGRSRVSFRDAAEDSVESEDETEEAQGGERWSGKQVGDGMADGSEFGPRVRRTGGGKRLSIGELPVDGSEAGTDVDEDNERQGNRVSLDDSPLDILGPCSEWHPNGAPWEGMSERRTRGRSRDGGEKDGRGEGCRVYSTSGWRERRRGWQGSSGEGEAAGSDATSEVWKLQAELGCGMVIMSIGGVSFGSVIMQRVKVDLTSQPDAVDVDLTVGDLDVVDMLANSKHYAHIFEPNGDLPSLNLVVRQNMVQRGPNLPAKPQVCVFVESQQTRMTAIFRFFNDFALFVERMAPIFSTPQASGPSKKDGVSAKGQDGKREGFKQGKGEGKTAGDSEGGDAPPLVFLHISDLSLCLPVSSWSEESLDVRVETINLIVPTPASQRLSQHTLLRLATGIRPRDPSFWKPLVDALDRSPPASPDSIGIQLSRFGAYWSPSKTITPKVERNIVSEGGVFISVQSNPSRVHVHWPQVEIRLGPTQYNAIMTLIFQNLAEGCSFTDDQVYNPQVGRPMGGEAAPPDPCISLAGLTPDLEIQLDFGRAVIHADMEHPATLVENGFGDPLLSLRAHRLTIVYSNYTDFSQVTVKAFRLLLVDDRFLKFSQSELALVETNSSRAKPSPTAPSASTRLSTPPNHPRPYTTSLGGESGQGLGCDLDRSFLVNVVMKQEGTTGVQVVFERTSIVWPFYTDLSLVWEFLEVVAGYFQKPGCALGPASLQPDSWLMVNILLHDFDLLLPVPEESLINVCPPPSSSHPSSPPANPLLATPSPITADPPAFHSAPSRMPPPSSPSDRFYDASEALPANRRSGSVVAGAGGGAASSGFGRSGSSDSGKFESARNTFEEPVWVPELQVWSDDVDLFLSELKAHGLKIRGQTLRVGHFAGGDRESKLLVDFIRVSSVFVHQSQYFAPHDVLGEFTAQLLFSQHSPKCVSRQASLLSLHITPDLHPSLSSTAPSPSAASAAFPASVTGGQSSSSAFKSGRLPVFFVFSHLVVLSSFLRTLSIRLKRSEGNLLHQNLDLYGDPLPPAFVPSKLAVNLQIHELFVALIDDRMGNPTSVLELVAKGIIFSATSQILTDGGPELLSCRLSLTLLSNFLNSGFEVLPFQLPLLFCSLVFFALSVLLLPFSAAHAPAHSPFVPLPPPQIMEPMTESWKLGADVKSTGNHVTIAVQSHQLLNVMFTPMQLRSLGDALNFYSLLSNSLSVLPGGSLHGGSDRDETLEASLQEVAVGMVSYRIVNLSGHTLYYWTEKDEEKSKTYSVEEGEEQVLEVQPVQKVVTLRDTRKILARTICVKLKGDWLPMNDIVMDKNPPPRAPPCTQVGKYVMDLRLPGSTVVLPVVFDVTLKSRTKIITVHSTMHLRNNIDVPLVFFALLPSPKETGVETAKSSSQVKKFSLGGSLCAVAGFARAEKDVVALDPEHLLEQQGLLEFPILNQGTRSPLVGRGSSGGGSSSNRLLSRFGSMTRRHSDGGGSLRLSELGSVRRGSMANGGEDEFDRGSDVGTSEEDFDSASDVRRPFYCCLQVISDPLAHSASNGLYEEFTLSFVPPVAIQNGLPYDLEAFVWDVEWGTRHIVYVPSGESRDLYHVSLDHTLQMHIALFVPGGEYRTRRRYPIHFPPNPLLQKQFGSRAFAYDVRTLSLAVKCRLFPQHSPAASPITLSIDNRHNWQSRNRSIALLAHYWVINLTKFRLKLSTGSSKNPLDCPRYQEGQPALLNVRRGAITAISLDGYHWSKSISIDSVGIKGSVAVAGPASTMLPQNHQHHSQWHHEDSSPHAELLRQQTAEEWENVVQLDAPAGAPSRHTTSSMSPFPALRRFEFGVEVRLAPSLCEGTKLVIISPRFMVSNQTGQPMQIAQIGTTTARVLADKMRQPFHWDDEKLGTYLVARLLSSDDEEEDDLADGDEEEEEGEEGKEGEEGEKGEEEDEHSSSSDEEHSEGEEEDGIGEGARESHVAGEVSGMQRLRRDSEDSHVSCESTKGREQVQAGVGSIGSGGDADGVESSCDKVMGLPKGKENAASGRLQGSGSDRQQQQAHSGAIGSSRQQVESSSSQKGDGSHEKREDGSKGGSKGGTGSRKKSAGKGRGSKGREMEVDWEWSGAFDIDKPGESAVRIRHRRKKGKYAILSIDVSLNGASALVTFDVCSSKHKPPPYRIENHSAFMSIKYGQLTTPTRQRLPPNRSTNYAWDQPRMAQLLQVEIEGFGVTREYDLDGIRELPTIILSEDDFTGNASLRDRMFVMVGTQARAVAALYVNVYADGATRVLSFSDTKHTSKVSEEDERTTLQEKLQVTSERIDFARKVLQRTRALAGDSPLDASEAKPSYLESPEYSAAMASFTPNQHRSTPSVSSASSSGRSVMPLGRSSSATPAAASTSTNPPRSIVTAAGAGSSKEQVFSSADSEGSSPRTPPETLRVFTGSSHDPSHASEAVGDPDPVTTPSRSPLQRSFALSSTAAAATAKEARASGLANCRTVSDSFDASVEHVKSQPGKAGLRRSRSQEAAVLQVTKAGAGGSASSGADSGGAAKLKGQEALDYLYLPASAAAVPDYPMRLVEATAYGVQAGAQVVKAGMEVVEGVGEVAEERLKGNVGPRFGAVKSSATEVLVGKIVGGARHVELAAAEAKGMLKSAAKVLSKEKTDGPAAAEAEEGRVKQRLAFMSLGKGKEQAHLPESKQDENDGEDMKGVYGGGGEDRRPERLVQWASGEENHKGLETDEVTEKAGSLSRVREESEEEMNEGGDEGVDQGSCSDAGRGRSAVMDADVTDSDAGRGGGDEARRAEKEESLRIVYAGVEGQASGAQREEGQGADAAEEQGQGEEAGCRSGETEGVGGGGGEGGGGGRSERVEAPVPASLLGSSLAAARFVLGLKRGRARRTAGASVGERRSEVTQTGAAARAAPGSTAGAATDSSRSTGSRLKSSSSFKVSLRAAAARIIKPAAPKPNRPKFSEVVAGAVAGSAAMVVGAPVPETSDAPVPVSTAAPGDPMLIATVAATKTEPTVHLDSLSSFPPLNHNRIEATRPPAASIADPNTRSAAAASLSPSSRSLGESSIGGKSSDKLSANIASDAVKVSTVAAAAAAAAAPGDSVLLETAVPKSEPAIHLDSLSSFPPLNRDRDRATPLSTPTADPNARSAAAAAASLSPSSRSLGESSSGGKNNDRLSANHSSSELQLPVSVPPSESAELEHHRSRSTEVAPAVADLATGEAAGEAAASETPGTPAVHIADDDPPSNNFQPSPELGARPTRGRVTWKGVVGQVGVGATAAVVNTGKRVTGAASVLHSAAAAFLDGTSEKVQEKFHEAQEAFEEAEERVEERLADEGFKAQVGAMKTVRSMESFFGRQADKLMEATRVPDMVKSATAAELRAHWPHDSFRLPSSRSEGGEMDREGEGNELMPVPTFEELQSMAGAVAAAELEFIGRNRQTGLVKSASVAAGQMAAVARRGQDVVVKAGTMVKGAVGSALAAGSEVAVAEGKALKAGAVVALNVMGGRLGEIKEHADQELQVSLADWRRRMQEAGIGVEEEEDISELRQERIHLGNEEYDAGAIVGGDVTIHVIKAMDLGLRPEKTHPYTVVQVEGRRLRSSVCKGTVCPQWDELLVFKGVSTTSSMAVSIFSSETIGSHKFLGQVVLPLVDGRALNREPGWHKLSRRTAHETVTGRVFLSTSWDATELELMALQLRAKEAELDALEERLAQEREARPREAVMAAETLANPHPLQPHMPSSGLRTPTGGPMLRRMFTLRGPGVMGAAASSVSPAVVQQLAAKGQLKVKVVEARHLAVPAEWLRSVHRMRAFAALSVVSPSGTSTLPVKTRVINGTFFPKWNETFSINDVALTSSLRVQVFDKPKLGSPNLLGEATVDVTTFKDGLPQYMLRTLKRSAGKEGEQEAVGGSIRLRVHWMVDHGKKAEEKTGVNFMVNLHGMTVSVVDRLPREIMLVLLEDICCSWEESVKEVAGKVEVGKLQVDNQLLTARNPVVLSRTQAFPAEALFMEQGKELANQASLASMLSTDPKEKEKAFVSVEFTRLLQHPSIVYYRRFLFQLQEFDLVLEEDFVDTAVAYLQQLPMEDLWQDKEKRGGEEEEKKQGDEDLVEDMTGAPITKTYLARDATMVSPMSRRNLVKSEPLEPLVNSSSWVAGNQGLRWYFERFQVQSMRINVTLVMNPIKSDAPPPSGSSSEWHLRTTASTAGFPLISLTRAPLRLNSLVLDNAFQNQSTLQTYVLRHYGVQLLQGLHKILGSVELLGAPLSLVDNLATGVMDFFVEPASATTPEEFLSGAMKGTVSLMKHSSYGVLHSISSLAGGIGTGFAKLTFDDSFIQRFSQRPEGTSQQVLRGAQDLGLGFVGAVTGLVLQPLEGARREGAVGAVKGVGKGVVGLVTKPLSGLLGFASTLTESAGTGIRAIGGDVSRRTVPRIRLPSTFGRNDAIALEPEDSVELKLVLAILDFGRYRDEHLLDHLQTSGRKAVLFTIARLIFYDCQRNVFYWQIPLKDITSVMGMEGRLESIILYDADVVIAGKKLPLRIPARKVIKTTTRELHMALLVKLNRHLARICAELPSSSSPSTPRHASREPVAAGAADSGSIAPSRGPSASSSPAPSPSPSLPSPLRLAQSPGSVSAASAGGGKAAGRSGAAAGAGVGRSSSGGGASDRMAGRAFASAQNEQEEEEDGGEKAEKDEEGVSGSARVMGVTGGVAAATGATRWRKHANGRGAAGAAADKGKSPVDQPHSGSAPVRARKSSFRRGKAGGGEGGYKLGKHCVIPEDADVDLAQLDQEDSDEDDYREDANGVVARVVQLDREERQEVRRNLDAILTTCQVASASAGGRSDPASALVSVKFLALAAYSRVQSHRAHQATLGARALQGVQRGDSQWEEDVSALLRTMVALSEGADDPRATIPSVATVSGENGSLKSTSQAGAHTAAQEASDDDVLIELKDVYKSFGSKHILRGASLKIRRGEAVGVIGPSGTGKSTILKIMAGLLAPDKGEVWICGKKREGLISDQENVGLRIGLVFQSAALFDSLTVRENVGFLLYEHSRLSEEEIRLRVKDSLKAVGLKNVEERFPSELSGGMKKRVALARAIVSDSDAPQLEEEVVMYDEPTAGLDPIASTVVEDLIRSLHVGSSVPVPVTAEIAAGLESDFETESEDSEDEGVGGGRGVGGGAGGSSRDGSGVGSVGGSKARRMASVSSYIVVTHQHSTIRRAVDRLLFLYGGEVVWEGPTEEFDTTDNPIVRQFAVGSLDGPIRY
ncbi:unnamed protein product [Closterium sp. Naga37s-1]|nr:unnamed protein product [Closterium sp. Naga37s-1]